MPSLLTLKATIFTREQLDTHISITQLFQIALAGRSNVGKSSLVNALAGRRQLAKTSSTPGKTRSINCYLVSPENFWLVDLPGYGYARCSHAERQKWANLIENYLENCKTLRALALLLDCRLSPQKLDKDLAAFAISRDIPLLPVLTKADQCKQAEQAKRQQEWAVLLDGIIPTPVSAKTGRGLNVLWAKLREGAV
jgi:GTP-binding protein